MRLLLANLLIRFTPCSCKYKKSGDFIGMDMARKFLEMGFTRARRYANHHVAGNTLKLVKLDHRRQMANQ